jgi:protein phosphatase
MGGHQAGEVASNAVVSVLPKLIQQRVKGLASGGSRGIQLALREAVLELSRRLLEESTGRADLKGMGATLALAWLPGSSRVAHLVHMGDSRIYLFRQGRLSQMTEDHSLAALLVKHGEISLEEARRHPARSRLSRYIGMEAEAYPDAQTIELQAGDRLLLCSDGLTSMLPDEQIAQILAQHPDPGLACRSLVETANRVGGEDNVTVVVGNYFESSRGN